METMEVTKEEKKLILEMRERKKEAEVTRDIESQYDNCYGRF